ncbi:Hypothetical predicted protein [Pelobates cultripes]|uniref:Uncharacterized protein n=1 Tax=Pelobates cultripes TaxID=61616 RepID=A0AAD1W1T5_PELCU|nr:Hypothetical predicted protein [Pelobates cultripes]
MHEPDCNATHHSRAVLGVHFSSAASSRCQRRSVCWQLHQLEKTKILKILKTNFSKINSIPVNGSLLEEVQFITYLGSIIDQQGGTDADVKARTGKARVAFIQLKNIWVSRKLTLTTKT